MVSPIIGSGDEVIEVKSPADAGTSCCPGLVSPSILHLNTLPPSLPSINVFVCDSFVNSVTVSAASATTTGGSTPFPRNGITCVPLSGSLLVIVMVPVSVLTPVGLNLTITSTPSDGPRTDGTSPSSVNAGLSQ